MCTKIVKQEKTLAVEKPQKITEEHVLKAFDCGKDVLNDFLQKKAAKNNKNNASKTYVTCYQGTNDVAGYYSLASGAVIRSQAPKPMQRNMPNDIPIVVLGRLAVDMPCQGQGLGEDLLADAIENCLQASEHIAIRALLVHALDANVAVFYKKHGFIETPDDPLILMLPLSLNNQNI